MNPRPPKEGDWQTFAHERMGRAWDSLQAARSTLEDGFGHTAVNRLYYACFYAAEALLASGQHSAKTHKGVRTLFNKHFVKPGSFPPDLADFYNDLFDERMKSDYEAFVEIDAENVRSWLPQAEAFIEEVAAQIDADDAGP
ncbi:MAG: hypothetical protein BRD38_03730 [Bacteroidetes bacterium QH_9_67_14]|nr:MAG: hypothetical protein BRD38_03730 [Bacteroidetes bacterium QH_9_67_14]